MEGKAATHDVESAVRKRQRVDAAARPGHIADLLLRRLPPRLLQHCFGGVEPGRVADALGEGDGDAAGSAGDIQGRVGRQRIAGRDQQVEGFLILQRR